MPPGPIFFLDKAEYPETCHTSVVAHPLEYFFLLAFYSESSIPCVTKCVPFLTK